VMPWMKTSLGELETIGWKVFYGPRARINPMLQRGTILSYIRLKTCRAAL
jgi:hypothetical protein